MQPPEPACDLALVGATLLSGVEGAPALRDAVIGIANQRIRYVGTDRAAVAGAKRTIELPGRVVTPGFVNVHTHCILTMVRGVAADLGFAPSYTPGIPKGTDLTPDDARALARLGALEALLFGSTLVADNFVHADVTLEAMAELGMRLYASWRIHDVDFARVARGEWIYDPKIGERTLSAGLALAARWNGRDRIGVQIAAHAPDTCSPAFLREIAAVAHREGLRVNTHLAQSAVEVERVQAMTGMSPTELLDDVGLLDDRTIAGHCIYVSDADVARIARGGTHVAHIAKCNAASGRFAPTPKFKRAGINMALATDTQNGDMVEAMRWALVTARVQEGGVNDEWQPEDVLRMATLGGARAMGLAHEIGSIEPGKRADLVVLDFRRPHLTPAPDPLGNLVHNAHGRDVEMVLVDGEILVDDGRPTRVDMDEVCREAERVSRRLWAAAGRPY
jgi:5-methylthioadenosine/S-adenosylhomocysteine deaminase